MIRSRHQHSSVPQVHDGDQRRMCGEQVTKRRLDLGLSQEALARKLGVSRQFIGAVELGKSQPSLSVALEMARALNTTVEALFSTAKVGTDHHIASGFSILSPGTRLALATIREQKVAYPLEQEEGLQVADARYTGSGKVQMLDNGKSAALTLVVMGCDPALPLLSRWISENGFALRLLTFIRGSEKARNALQAGEIHLAGVHVRTGANEVDELTGFPSPQPHPLPPLAQVHFAHWELGIAVAPGNPKGIENTDDLLRADVRWAKREPGSVARERYREALARTGHPEEAVHWAAGESKSHMEVARGVAFGLADAGLTTVTAAHFYQLTFLPLEEHTFSFLLSQDDLKNPLIERWLNILNSSECRRQIASLWGYDVQQMGQVRVTG